MNEIDLTNYFKKRYRFEEINNVSIDGKNYIFKFLPRDNLFKYDLENFYNDLIVSELCEKVGIESCKVYLGKYKNRYGTLVENYKTNDKAIYVNGSIIFTKSSYVKSLFSCVDKFLILSIISLLLIIFSSLKNCH